MANEESKKSEWNTDDFEPNLHFKFDKIIIYTSVQVCIRTWDAKRAAVPKTH
jgi:hypothetical protein